MKLFSNLILASIFLFITSNCWSMDINHYHSGSWYNSSQSGHGFSIEVIDENRVLLYWFVYNPDRTSTFLLTVADINGSTATGTTYYYSGMRFGEFNTNDVNEQVWGTVTITFHSCDSATLQYSSTMAQGGTAFGSGSIQLTRLIGIHKLQCSNNPYAGLYQGNFFSDATGQVIPGVALLVPNGEFVGVSYDAVAAFGTWSVTNDSITINGFAISMDANNYHKGNITSTGAIEADHRLNASYSIAGGDFGLADLFATTALYRRGTSKSAIAGHYTGTNLITGVQANISISATGAVSGKDVGSTCTYGGQLQIPDQSFNMVKVNVVVTNCGVSNGQYNGYGMVDDAYYLGDRRRLLLSATNGTYAAVVELAR